MAEDIMKNLETLGHPNKRTSFRYEGSCLSGVTLYFDSGTTRIEASFFQAALKHFSGRDVTGGFKMDDPPPAGFGAWVESTSARLNSMKLTPRHGSFIAAILCDEAGVKSWLDGNAVWLRFP
jgi:hypothetical protein